jgi:hypothetical protein
MEQFESCYISGTLKFQLLGTTSGHAVLFDLQFVTEALALMEA